MTVKEKIAELQIEFQELEDALMKYTYLIELGTLLPEMPEEDKIDRYLVKDCHAKVWLKLANPNGKLLIEADSNTAVMRGILYLIKEVCHKRSLEEIKDVPDNLFVLFGLDYFLTERRHGIAGILQMIFDYADEQKRGERI